MIAAGTTTGTLTITVVDDALNETGETVTAEAIEKDLERTLSGEVAFRGPEYRRPEQVGTFLDIHTLQSWSHEHLLSIVAVNADRTYVRVREDGGGWL